MSSMSSHYVDYDKIYLFGDSITEFSFSQKANQFGFGAALADGNEATLNLLNARRLIMCTKSMQES